MIHFIKPEYLISLYLILNEREEVTLKDLGDYAETLNKALKEQKIEAVFLYSNKYVDEMLSDYNYFEYNGIYEYEDEANHYCTQWIKRKVSNELLSEQFIAYLSNDVLKVACDLNDAKDVIMSTEEKLKVMKAYTEGKSIQSKAVIGEHWCDDTKPTWDWNHFEYRIKPESKYRPYKSQEELLTDFWVKNENEKIASIFGGLWLKDKETGVEYLVNALNGVGSLDIKLSETWFTYEQAFEKFVYLNDTPFGIKE